MLQAFFTALTEDAPNMLLTLLLISFLIIWLQSKFNREFGTLRKEIAEGKTAIKDEIAGLRKEVTDVDKGLRKEIGGISTRLARIEGKLELPAYALETEPYAQTG